MSLWSSQCALKIDGIHENHMKNPSNENKRPRFLDPLPITLHVVEKVESKIKSFWQSLNSAIEEKGFQGFISYPK